MPKKCVLCGSRIPYKAVVNGKCRNFQRRKYCLICSPFGSGNTRKLENPKLNEKEKKKRNNEKYRKWQNKARIQRKIELIKMLGGKCNRCGYSRSIHALSFHHINPDDKSFSFFQKGMLTKMKDLVEEVKKCELLCMNCHMELHHETPIQTPLS